MIERRPPRETAVGLWHQPSLLNLLADLLGVCALIAWLWIGMQWLFRLPLFALTTIHLENAPVRASVVQIEDVARRTLAGNFFTLDLEAASAEFEKIPWVRRAILARQWPEGLRLTLEEHRPVARWQVEEGGEMTHYVNEEGEVFAAEAIAEAATLPLLIGPHPREARKLLARHHAFATQLAEANKSLRVTQLSSRGAWRLELAQGTVIELGREDARLPLESRLARYIEAARHIEARLGEPRRIDLRYANGFALSGLPKTAAHASPPATPTRKS
ncbi:MAG: cell division protein FtsQ/DivIB [Rhodocyclaceae bacterium]|nr:cell division protein FtsQ/DivIB [Rhodocyclaceae bacterium]